MRQVLGLAWPVMVSMLSYTAMGLADTIYVGWLGTTQLAAVGIAAVAGHLVHSFGSGLVGGVKIAVSQATGAGDVLASRRATWQGLWIALFLGALVAATGLAAAPVFALVGAEGMVASEAAQYFSLRVLGAPFWFATVALSGWFQGRGDTRTPMVATLVANAVNVALDPLFIFGLGPFPELGVAGAAIATVFGIASGVAVLAWRGCSELLEGPTAPTWAAARVLWRLGSPMGVRYLLEVGAFVLVAGALARLGDEAMAAHVLVIRIVSVSFLPGHAVGEATGVLVGQAVGAARPGLAREAWVAGTWLAVGVMALFGLLFVGAPDLLLMPFGAGPELLPIARQLLVIAALFQVFDAVAMVGLGALNGAGDVRFAMRAGVLCGWLVKLPVGFVLAFPAGLGAAGAWLGLTAEIIVIAAVVVWRIRRGPWLASAVLPTQPAGQSVAVAT